MKIAKITGIEALEILDSRGNPTVQATVFAGDLSASASVPSGASTGTHEAMEMRDDNKKRYNGLGVEDAVRIVNTSIAKALLGFDAMDQINLDNLLIQLDGTKNKSKLGANSILAVSMAAARLSSVVQKKQLYQTLADSFAYGRPKSLPTPMMNIINGGVHADSGLDVQEYMLVPQAKTFKEQLRTGAEIYSTLKKLLKKQKLSTAVGDEGGFAPKTKGNDKPLDMLIRATKDAKYTPFKDCLYSVDVAASEFYDSKKKVYNFQSDKKKRKPKDTLKMYAAWAKKYKLFSIEDGFAEDDFASWKELQKSLGDKLTLVGDDLFVTNVERLKIGIEEKLANAILIKLNQIGTVSETVAAIKLAQKNNFKVIVSHRSGETSDTFIADLAVATGAGFIKTGSLARGERVAKYNRLLEIENKLGI